MSNQYKPTEVSPPGESLEELLQERGLTSADLAARMGRDPEDIDEIIRGGPITPEMALQLEHALTGPSAQFWNNREATYREWLAGR